MTTITWYRTTGDWRIDRVQLLSFTQLTVVLAENGRRTNRSGELESYYPTLEEAKAGIIADAESGVIDAQKVVEWRQQKLDKVRAFVASYKESST